MQTSKSIRGILSFIFAVQILFINNPLYASSLDLPAPGKMIALSPAFNPVMLEGLSYDPKHPFQFGFIVRPGEKKISDDQLRDQAMDMVRYFMATLTIPQEDVWVNLSPYEKNRIIPDNLAVTRLGGDMLSQDYILKQLTSSLIHPDSQVGKVFWQKIYKGAQERFGRTDIVVDTFNKVWIVPSEADVFVHGNTVVVTGSHLKVMMEEDYMASQKVSAQKQLSDAVMRQVVLPVLEREVNEGTYFAPLRQILNAAILAEWYKRHLKQTLLARYYADHQKVKGIDVLGKDVKDSIYKQYIAAYKQGVYNFIREDLVPGTQQIVPRKYFSGGLNMTIGPLQEQSDPAMLKASVLGSLQGPADRMMNVRFLPASGAAGADKAMIQEFIQNTENPFWIDTKNRILHQTEFLNSVDPYLIDLLVNHPLRGVDKGAWKKIIVNNFQSHSVFEVRIDNNNILGTPKGGIRYLTPDDLLKPTDPFYAKWQEFLQYDPSEEQAKAFVAKWLTEEAESLALLMTFKAAGLDLHLGGAKGIVFKGDIVRGTDGQIQLKDWYDGVVFKDQDERREQMMMDNLYAVAHFSQELTNDEGVGVDTDSPAPDKGTGPKEMEEATEVHLRILTARGKDAFIYNGRRYDDLYERLKIIFDRYAQYKIWETPLLEETVRYLKENHGVPVPWLGAYTGKRYGMGGVQGRNEATGEGVVIVMKEFLDQTANGYQGKTVAVQAFGNVGRYTALAAAREGFKVTVINDYGITLEKPQGWTFEELQNIIQQLQTKKLILSQLWLGGFIPEQGIRATTMAAGGEAVFNAVMGADVDILVPAFQEGQITKDNYQVIKAKWIFEGANGPTTPDAEAGLIKEGKIIVPDTLANAGGVLCSGLEMEQALRGYEFTKEEVMQRMVSVLQNAVTRTIAYKTNGINMREAFDRLALVNLAHVRTKRSNSGASLPPQEHVMAAAPNGGIDLNTAHMFIKENGQNSGLDAMIPVNSAYWQHLNGLKVIFIDMQAVDLPFLLGIKQ